MILEFDAVKHIYTLNNRVVPGCSEILESVGLSDFSNVPPDLRESALKHGAAVDEMTTLFDMGFLDEDEIPESLESELQAYKAFTDQFKPSWQFHQTLIGNELAMYATHLDRAGIMLKHRTLLEIKTGQNYWWHGIQLALQRAALQRTHGFTANKLVVLYLHRNGKFTVKDYMETVDMDYAAGMAAMTIYNRKRIAKGA